MSELAQVTLDDCPIEFVIPGGQGFKVDVLEAELLCEQASDGWKKEFLAYKDKLHSLLSDKYNVALSDTQLFKFTEAVVAAFDAFKKKLDRELPSALGLAATPSESATENT